MKSGCASHLSTCSWVTQPPCTVSQTPPAGHVYPPHSTAALVTQPPSTPSTSAHATSRTLMARRSPALVSACNADATSNLEIASQDAETARHPCGMEHVRRIFDHI